MAGAVSDSSPLISLSAAGDLALLPRMFGTVTIPSAVYREVVIEAKGLPGAREICQAEGDWLVVCDPADLALVETVREGQNLHAGESEAIVLAQQSYSPVLLDEQRAVRYARSLGSRVVRTPAVYAAAKAVGLIPSVRVKLDLLRSKRFFLKQRDYESILRMLGEL